MMSWFKAHIWLGLLAFGLVIAHVLVRPITWNFSTGKLALIVFAILVLSGILWRIVYRRVPPQVARGPHNLAIADTTDPPRWEAFARSAAAHGVCSTLSVPLFVGDRALGALNLYSRTVDGFADDASAQLFALQASVVLANSQAYWAAQALGVQLQTALESRAVIEQAKGVLVGRHGCDPETAFTMLRDESQRRNVKLREVASETVRDAGTGRAGIGPAAAD